MKRFKLLFIAALALILAFSFAACDGGSGGGNDQTVSYLGMKVKDSLSEAGNLATRTSSVQGDLSDNDKSVNQGNPFEGQIPIEEKIGDTLWVLTTDKIAHYAQANKDVYIVVQLSNPDNFVILSFTLNGKHYQSYMFEYGSDNENLILKSNVGATAGIIEYTIDNIKYVDGTQNKDVKIEGDKTIKVGVFNGNQAAVQITDELIGLDKISLNAKITDADNLVSLSNGYVKAVLYDGVSLVASKNLAIGENTVSFDGLTPNKKYQYAVFAYYDNLSGNPEGSGMHILSKKAFFTEAIVLFDANAIVAGKDSVNFGFKWNTDAPVKSLTAIELYKSGVKEKELTDLNGKAFTGLLSNTDYTVKASYKNLKNETESISFKFTTLTKAVPEIEIYDVSLSGDSVSFKISATDTDNTGAITAIELYKDGVKEKELTNLAARIFTELVSGSEYQIKVVYSYNLNDGAGAHTLTAIYNVGRVQTGTKANPHKITTASQMTAIATAVNLGETYEGVYFELNNNIDLGGMEWTPIGTDNTLNFVGNFDGKGFVISNYKITTAQRYAGLFGRSAGEIKNVGVENFTIEFVYSVATVFPGIYAGGLVSSNGGLIENCYAISGSISINNISTAGMCEYMGGLVGISSDDGSLIKNCHAAVSVSGKGSVIAGGLIGSNISKSTVTNCYSTGNVAVEDGAVATYASGGIAAGGLIGTNNSEGVITNCYATGKVSLENVAGGTVNVGGFVGNNINGSSISNCFSSGSTGVKNISSITVYIGGFAGNNGNSNSSFGASSIKDCYASGSLSTVNFPVGLLYAGGFAGANGAATDSIASTILNCLTVSDMGEVNLTGGYGSYVGNTIGFSNALSTAANCYYGSVYGDKLYDSNTNSSSPISQLNTASFYTGTLNWSGSVWDFSGLDFANWKLPLLKEVFYEQEPVLFDNKSTVIGKESIGFDFLWSIEPSLTAIELYKNGVKEKELTDLNGRAFTGLLSNTEYTVKASYKNLKNETESISFKFTTLAKTVPEIELNDVSLSGDSVSFKISVTDTDNTGAITAIELYKDGVKEKELTDLKSRIFTELVSGSEYQIKVVYSYNLNDGAGAHTLTAIYNVGRVQTGTKANPHKITTGAQMAAIATAVNSGETYSGVYFELRSDINLDGIEWTPIGITNILTFEGYFDGCGFVISNFKITTEQRYAGLFGRNGGEIRNLVTEDFTISFSASGLVFAGGLVASNGGVLENCAAINGSISIQNTSSSNVNIGGLTASNAAGDGYASGDGYVGLIIRCRAAVSISGKGNITAGGLVGININEASITNCYSTSSIKAESRSDSLTVSIGGLIGTNNTKGTVASCYAAGSISVETVLGGLVNIGGFAGNNINGAKITDCYATSSVAVSNVLVLSGVTVNVGGFVGNNSSNASYTASTIVNCYATGSMNLENIYDGTTTAGGFAGANGATGGAFANIVSCFTTAILTDD